MRILATVLALSLTFLLAACAPQASGPPAGGGEQVTAPAGTPAAGPETAGTPAAMPEGHPPVSGGASPPAGHMEGQGARSITETEGAVVSVMGDELIVARPSGPELKFIIPLDLKVLPAGKTRGDLVEGAKIKIKIEHVDKGMEADTIEFLGAPPATK